MLPTSTTKNLVDAVVTSLEQQGIVEQAVHAFVAPGVIQWITPPLSLPGTLGGRPVADVAEIKVNCQEEFLYSFWRRNLERLRAGWLADPRGIYKGVAKALRNVQPGLSRFLLCPPSSHELEEHTLIQFSIEVANVAAMSMPIVDSGTSGSDYWVRTAAGNTFGVSDGVPWIHGFKDVEPFPSEPAMLLHAPRGVYAGSTGHSLLDNITNYVETNYSQIHEAEGLLTALALLKLAFWHVDPAALEARLTTAGRRKSAERKSGYQIKSVRRRWRSGEPLPDSAKRVFAEAFQMLYSAPYFGQAFLQSLYAKLVPNFLTALEFRTHIGHPERNTLPVPKDTTLKRYENGMIHVANLYNLEVPCRPANTLWSKVS
ncbi:hypothetical protein [Cupriavidus necator]